MKITPLEIRQKTFEKKLRGYDKDEVNAFLLSLSQEWERMIDANKELKYRLEVSEKEVKKLREVESSLFKTLKTAEDTGANMIEQANKTAELHLRETQMNADSILNEAKTKSRKMLEEAGTKSGKALEVMEDKLKELFQSYKSLENQRDHLASEIKHLAEDSIEKIGRLVAQGKGFDFEGVLAKMNDIKPVELKEDNPKPLKEELPLTDVVKDSVKKDNKKKESSSFFDEIE